LSAAALAEYRQTGTGTCRRDGAKRRTEGSDMNNVKKTCAGTAMVIALALFSLPPIAIAIGHGHGSYDVSRSQLQPGDLIFA
jgi:hypothetical protein